MMITTIVKCYQKSNSNKGSILAVLQVEKMLQLALQCIHKHFGTFLNVDDLIKADWDFPITL